MHGDGCDLHTTCFDCPLSACRYDLGPGQARRQGNALTLARLLGDGLTPHEAALALGVTERTVYRLRRLNAGEPA